MMTTKRYGKVGWIVLVLVGLGNGRAAQAIDLTRLKLVFDEECNTLDVSAHGPGTTWTAHTPWAGDFGQARFVDPARGFPFSTRGGICAIALRRRSDRSWESGLLASVDPSGKGFAQRYGYFEVRARLPAGPGVWPSFWLDSMPPGTSRDASLEVDVFEQYGQFPAAYNSTVTVWPKGDPGRRRSVMKINSVPAGSLSSGFHRFGVMVDPAQITFYLDDAVTWQISTPPEHKDRLMILLDLGLGGGWPINRTPSPSIMQIDYVRAYAFRISHWEARTSDGALSVHQEPTKRTSSE